MHYYQHNIGDYLSHCASLSLLEHGVYLRLLQTYYANEAPITSVDPWRCVGARSQEEKDAVAYILDTFFVLKEEGYRQARCDQEIAKYRDKKEQASKAGKASAERRTNGRSTDVQQTLNSRTTDVQPTNNHKPITINQEINTERKRSTRAEPVSTVSVQDLVLEGVDKQQAADWLKLRRDKKLALTRSAWDAIKEQGRSIGMSPAEVVKTCNASSWAGFKASWLGKEDQGKSQSLNLVGGV